MQATAPPGVLPELARDEGMCLYGLGRYPEAAEVLTTFLHDAKPDTRDTAIITVILEKIKERAAAAAAAAVAAGRGSSSGSSGILGSNSSSSNNSIEEDGGM